MKLRRYAPIIPWVGLCLFFMMALLGEQGLLRLWQIQSDREDLSQALERADAQTLILESQVQRMRNDPRFIEKVAREELNLVRDNEILFRFEE